MVDDDQPAETEFTPAVQRAAELLIREAETTGLITADVRNGLAAALDVEEMALFRRVVWIVREVERTRASAVRTAILGGAS
jgi:hypothetical protein